MTPIVWDNEFVQWLLSMRPLRCGQHWKAKCGHLVVRLDVIGVKAVRYSYIAKTGKRAAIMVSKKDFRDDFYWLY